MFVKVYPSDVSSFVMARPSILSSHYAILMAALAKGVTKIENIIYTDDIMCTLGSVQKLGAGYMITDDALLISGIDTDRERKNEKIIINCGRCEETLKFILPVATFFFEEVEFILDGTLANAPLSVFEKMYSVAGGTFVRENNSLTVSGRLTGGTYEITDSTDYKSICGLMLVCPLFDDYTEIIFPEGENISQHIKNFVSCQQLLGISWNVVSKELMDIDGGKKYECRDLTIDTDMILSAYFMLLGAFGSGIDIIGINEDETDRTARALIEILEKAEIKIEYTENALRIKRSKPCRFSVDLTDFRELIPVIILLAVYTPGFSVIKGIGEPSEMLRNLIYELRSADVRIGFSEGNIVIEGAHIQKNAKFNSYNDANLAMFFGAYASLSEGICVIEDAGTVNAIYPDFWHDLRCIGIRVDEEKNNG